MVCSGPGKAQGGVSMSHLRKNLPQNQNQKKYQHSALELVDAAPRVLPPKHLGVPLPREGVGPEVLRAYVGYCASSEAS